MGDNEFKITKRCVLMGFKEFIEDYLLLKKNMDCLEKPSIEAQLKCILKTNKPKRKKKKKKTRRKYYA